MDPKNAFESKRESVKPKKKKFKHKRASIHKEQILTDDNSQKTYRVHEPAFKEASPDVKKEAKELLKALPDLIIEHAHRVENEAEKKKKQDKLNEKAKSKSRVL